MFYGVSAHPVSGMMLPLDIRLLPLFSGSGTWGALSENRHSWVFQCIAESCVAAVHNPIIAAVSAGEASNISAGWPSGNFFWIIPAKALEAVGVMVCASNETFEVL